MCRARIWCSCSHDCSKQAGGEFIHGCLRLAYSIAAGLLSRCSVSYLSLSGVIPGSTEQINYCGKVVGVLEFVIYFL